MLDTLYKKAKGFEVTETTREYGADEEGTPKLLKEKETTKYFPPDLASIKAYMDLKSEEYGRMSDEELKKERTRLLKELEAGPEGDYEKKEK